MQPTLPLDLTAILLMVRTDLGSQLLLRVPQSLKDADSPSPVSVKSPTPSAAPASSPLIISAPSKSSAQLTPALGSPSGTLLPAKPSTLKVSSAPKSLQPQLAGRTQEGAAVVGADMSDARLEQFLVPDVSNYDKPFEAGIGDVLFIGFPTTIPVDDERRRKLEQLSQREQTKFPLLLMVNVIFVLRRGADLHKVKGQFSRVSSLYAATLAHEEMHRCFLAIETQKIMRTKELLRKNPPKDSATFEKALTKNSALADQLLVCPLGVLHSPHERLPFTESCAYVPRIMLFHVTIKETSSLFFSFLLLFLAILLLLFSSSLFFFPFSSLPFFIGIFTPFSSSSLRCFPLFFLSLFRSGRFLLCPLSSRHFSFSTAKAAHSITPPPSPPPRCPLHSNSLLSFCTKNTLSRFAAEPPAPPPRLRTSVPGRKFVVACVALAFALPFSL